MSTRVDNLEDEIYELKQKNEALKKEVEFYKNLWIDSGKLSIDEFEE